MPIRQIILETRHWFRNILVTLVIYLPIITSAGTKKVKSIFHEVLPESFSEITNDILGNIYLYFHGLYFDWSCNAVGVIFFLVLVVFFASFVIDAWKNIENKPIAMSRIAMISFGLVIFLLCPLGANIPINLLHHKVGGELEPRLLYAFGILISCILYKNYLFMESRKILKNLYKAFLFFFALWNIIYMNSFGNIMHMQKILQNNVFYDMANDFYEIKNQDPRFFLLSVIGNIHTPAADNFFKLYPINRRILPEWWDMAIFHMLGLYIQDQNNLSLVKIDIEDRNWQGKVLLKSKQWYDIYTVGGTRISVEMKSCSGEQDGSLMFMFNR
ncbi:hypothetical protein FACS189449_09820 [Alphaproteobacteria bacterium]|nr:hypothetical protein FACS189449_09820 [Alphaproteobacteria bacterium]